jgi:hypothetical protein
MRFLFALALALTTTAVHADIVVENDLIIPAEIYDFTYSTSSTQWWQSTNHTKYYCVFRNTWTIKNHPYEYPKAARWSNIMVYSSTKEYRPWLKNRATTLGIKTLVEVSKRAVSVALSPYSRRVPVLVLAIVFLLTLFLDCMSLISRTNSRTS